MAVRRNPRSTASPLLRVKLVDIVGRKGKVKIRFEDGRHPGLECVAPVRLLCRGPVERLFFGTRSGLLG